MELHCSEASKVLLVPLLLENSVRPTSKSDCISTTAYHHRNVLHGWKALIAKWLLIAIQGQNSHATMATVLPWGPILIELLYIQTRIFLFYVEQTS